MRRPSARCAGSRATTASPTCTSTSSSSPIACCDRAARYCLIVPDKWLTAAYGRPLRELLAREASLEQLVDFGHGLFADADAFPCIVAGTVGAGHRTPVRASRVLGTSVAGALAAAGTKIPRARLGAGPWHLDRPADAVLADRLAQRWPPLAEVLPAPSRGIVTGCNRAFVVDGATRARLGGRADAAALVRPFLKGRDIRRWRAAEIDRYVLLIDRGTVPPPGLRAHLAQFRDALEPGTGRKPGTYKWFELQDPVVPLARSRAPRLFYQDIQTGPACCLDRYRRARAGYDRVDPPDRGSVRARGP